MKQEFGKVPEQITPDHPAFQTITILICDMFRNLFVEITIHKFRKL